MKYIAIVLPQMHLLYIVRLPGLKRYASVTDHAPTNQSAQSYALRLAKRTSLSFQYQYKEREEECNSNILYMRMECMSLYIDPH